MPIEFYQFSVFILLVYAVANFLHQTSRVVMFYVNRKGNQ